MKLNKKVIESMTVAAAMVVMSTFTAFAGSTDESITVAETKSINVEKTGTAGIIVELHKMETEAMVASGLIKADIIQTESTMVAEANVAEAVVESGISAEIAEVVELAVEENVLVSEEVAENVAVAEEEVVDAAVAEEPASENTEVLPEETKTAEAEQPVEEVVAEEPVTEQSAENVETEEPVAEQPAESVEAEESVAEQQPENTENEEWSNQVMADVEEDMNIRTAPDETSELAGKFYRGDVAEIVEVGEEWTEITSGNVTGYVKNDYLVYGDEALELANEVCTLYATVNTDGLRLRSEPNEEAGIVTTASTGERLKVDKETESVDGWVAVQTSDSTAYVSADYVEVALNLGTALNTEEVAKKEAAKKAEEAKKAGMKPAMSASTDEVVLLGALIQCEAGGSSYEGMLAVGSVVMNRVRSGGYPNSISGVVYQPGQFPPALNGSVANVMAGGVRAACLQAAQEAINGRDIVNGAVQFRSASSGYGGTVIGGNVFF